MLDDQLTSDLCVLSIHPAQLQSKSIVLGGIFLVELPLASHEIVTDALVMSTGYSAVQQD